MPEDWCKPGFDQRRDLKLEMVAHPEKREERPLLNFSLISSHLQEPKNHSWQVPYT